MKNNAQNLGKLTANAKEVLSNAHDLALDMGSKEVQLEHVFIVLLVLKKGLAARFLRSLGVDLDKTVVSIQTQLKKSYSHPSKEIGVSEDVKELIKIAFLLAHQFGHVYVGTEHLLLAFLKKKNLKFIKELEKAGLDYTSMKEKLFSYATYAPGVFVQDSKKEEKEPEAINYFGRSLNLLAKEGKLMPIIGRDKEIERLIRILSRHTKNNPILVGEAGVGKTAVVEGLVQRIVRGDVPESIKDLEIYQIDLASIIAGSKVRGDVEQRLLVLISEVSSSPNKILFIDEIHMIVGAGATGSDRSMDVANILKPRLTEGSVRIIGATTLAEHREFFEEDAALSRRFQQILVDEISVEDGIKILKGVKARLEEFHGVKILNDAIMAAIKLSDRYIADRYLPDKAIDVLDEAASEKKLLREESSGGSYSQMVSKLLTIKKKKDKAVDAQLYEKALDYKKQEDQMEGSIRTASKIQKSKIKNKNNKVTEEDIKKVISEWTGIPVTTLSTVDLKLLRGITRRIGRNVVGQIDAVKRVTATLKRTRLGFSDARRPLASFLFLGPTGVGKTEMGKVIAREFFGNEKSLIQVDMSEYMEQHSVAKIIGAPPGYVGYQEGGQLTEKVRKRPYSVILFDEVEKAHPELLSILLQILEEGQVTDSKGRKVSFQNSIIILTSNIGASDIGRDKILGFHVVNQGKGKDKLDEAYSRMRERLTEELKKTLKPEFINRIDEVIIFRALDLQDAEKITVLQINDLNKRLREKKIILKVADKVVELLAKEGFSEEYGARNIRRKVQELLENPLADLLLSQKMKFHKVKVTQKEGKFHFIPE